MRNLSKYFTGILAASLLVGCSDDNLAPDDKNNPTSHPEDAVYMQVTVKKITASPGGSRSQTDDPNDDYSASTDSIEVGSEAENRIYNVMLILADKQNNFISYALVGGLKDNNNNLPGQSPVTNNNSVTLTASFNRQDIDDFYAANKFTKNPTVHVFALCNYTQDMLNEIKRTAPNTSNWIGLSQKVVEYSPTSGKTDTGVSVLSTVGGLYMANAKIAEKSFPMTAEEWDAYTTEKTPFDLSGTNGDDDNLDNSGSILVERGVARFDFADGSKKKNQEYIIGTIKVNNPNNPSEPIIKETLKVKLVRMALVNMNNQFYYLRHVAPSNEAGDAADLSDTTIICKPEQPWNRGNLLGNWVIGSDAKWKNEYAAGDSAYKFNKAMLNEHFNFALGNGDGPDWRIDPTARNWWYNQTLNEVLSGHEDIDNDWNSDKTHLEYHVWRYVTENAIPSIKGQENGVSTGVVFKGQILPMEYSPEDLAAALNGTFKMNDKGEYDPNGTIEYNPILYVFDNVIYVKWTQIRAEALKQKAGSPLFNAVFGNSSMSADGTVKDDDLDRTSAEAFYRAWVKSSAITPKPDDNDEAFKAFRSKVVSEKIAIYQYSNEKDDVNDSFYQGKGGYFCYYFYWNRHNSNGRNGVMGPMEFQVVRNNVYKLAVTEISKLGHPRKTENDPDPEDPDNPDEESNVYFKVRVEVLPWVVRVNNIEF